MHPDSDPIPPNRPMRAPTPESHLGPEVRRLQQRHIEGQYRGAAGESVPGCVWVLLTPFILILAWILLGIVVGLGARVEEAL